MVPPLPDATPTRDRLAQRWTRLVARVAPDAGEAGADLAFHVVESLYAHPERHYHTLDHVAACLAHLDAFRRHAEDPDAVEYALFLHDAVYVPRRKDNEARSAAVAAMLADHLGARAGLADAAARLIAATAHAHPPDAASDPDAALIVDLDLSILAADAERYDDYAVAIRREHSYADDAAYRVGRCAFLRSMLSRSKVYGTAVVREKFESAARRNLKIELSTHDPAHA
jgi:predicted metal-dependent HD superfamily phosphohydrolase